MNIKEFIQSLPIETLVEVGCHFGTDTEDFRRMHPNARIICFEPDPRNINMLKTRNIDKVAEIYPYALSNQNGTAIFYQSSGVCPDRSLANRFGDWSLSSSLKMPTGHLYEHPWCMFPNKVEVQTIRLDDFDVLQNCIIDFMWVDVQGAEDLVFSGAKETLKRTKYVYTEYCNTELYKDQLNLQKLLDLFGNNWIVVHNFGGDVLLKNITFAT
jgi:FkbM family methyltransferase